LQIFKEKPATMGAI